MQRWHLQLQPHWALGIPLSAWRDPLSDCWVSGGSLNAVAPADLLVGQADGHQPDHRDLDHGLGAGSQPLVVTAEPAVADQPAERALHDPAAGQDLEAL